MSADLSNKNIGIAIHKFPTVLMKSVSGAAEAGRDREPICIRSFPITPLLRTATLWQVRGFSKTRREITPTKANHYDPRRRTHRTRCTFDILVIAPCTGNTLSKLANGISDTPVLMAAKAHLRNNRPLVVALSTSDALGMNLKNIGILLNTKISILFLLDRIIIKQKPNSMIAHMEFLTDTIIGL